VTDPVLIAGAGIGGLTAALALAKRGIGAALFEQAERLDEVGAGIQLAPNATRILTELGLADRLSFTLVEPEVIRVRRARTGAIVTTLPLGAAIRARYGAPYWLMHRADLQRALLEAVAGEPRIALTLGAKVGGFALDAGGIVARLGSGREYRGAALVCADGLWSELRSLLGDTTPPRFTGRTAWRATVAASHLPADMPAVDLWLGPGGHIVHYPIRAGAAVNIVAVARDNRNSIAWNTPAHRDEVLARFPATAWATAARELLATAEQWQRWAIFDRAASQRWGCGAATLLGDAAHPMLPYLAQGAAMAIEDAALLAAVLAQTPTGVPRALRAYEAARQPRTARAQRAARRNDFSYHLAGLPALIRDAVLRALGGERALAQYDWIYRWRLSSA
jgi:salicylate hydroxylase